MTSIWDDPELRSGGDFVKLESPGDNVAGTVTAIRKHRWNDGSVSPQILLVTDDGEEKTLTAGQVRLKALLAEKQPTTGDHITVTLTDVEPRGGGKTLKHFQLEVKPGAADKDNTAPAQPTPAPGSSGAVAADPAAVAAAIGNLTPEQKAALGIA